MKPNDTTNGGQDSKEPPGTMANETVHMEADPLKGPNTIETEQAVKIDVIVPTIESITDATANDDLVSNESKPVPQDAVVLEAVIPQESPENNDPPTDVVTDAIVPKEEITKTQ